MDYLPLFVAVKNQPCLVVGGGTVAARKVDMLLRAGAVPWVVAPHLCDVLRGQLETGNIHYRAGDFTASDLDNMCLAVAATDDEAVNSAVAAAAKARGVWVNVVDHPALCSFIFPSIIDRSPVIAAISTGGTAPVLARLLRARLESLIPAHYGRLATLAGELRSLITQRIVDPVARRRFWERALESRAAELIYQGRVAEARNAVLALADAASTSSACGEIYLVGAGPGDPDLLTFRALRLMQQADVVLYDRLVAPPLLDLVRREAERIYVGKKRAYHSLRQDEINDLMITLAQKGKRVLRLKGGDPFIFGRGGEEIERAAAAGIPFQVVPGITAAAGCASYAGIPLTHRDYAQVVIFVTGHLQDGTMNLNWSLLTQPHQTVVVYMGLLGLPLLCSQLMAHGLASDTPIALVQQGTTPQQRVIVGTLATLPAHVAREEIHAPTLLIIGEVVRLHAQLAWFHHDVSP